MRITVANGALFRAGIPPGIGHILPTSGHIGNPVVPDTNQLPTVSVLPSLACSVHSLVVELRTVPIFSEAGFGLTFHRLYTAPFIGLT